MSEAWYCKAFGQELGPMSFADLLELVERSDVLPTDEVKCGDHGAWGAASQEPRLFPQPAHAQVPAPAAEDLTDPEVLLAAASSAEPCTGPIAAVTAAAPDANLPEAIEEQRAPQEHATASEASTPAKPSTMPLNRKRLLACAAVLALCGVSAGAAARILLGAEAPAASSGGNAVEQQRIALLKQQIDDLMRQREELTSSAGASAPDQPSTAPPEPAGPFGSESPSKSEKSSPAGASTSGPAPADAVPPAPEKTPPEQQPPAADSPKAPTSVQQQGEADAKDPATMSAAGQSSKRAASNQPAKDPPAANPPGGAVASAVPAKAAQNAGGAASLLLQAQTRHRQRFELLREIYEQRAGLLVEYAKLQAQVESLESAIAATETAYAEVNAAGAAVLAQIGLAGNATLIQSLMRQYAALDGEASQLKIQRQQQTAEQAELMAKAKKVDEQAAELRSTWLAVVDPFGQLDHGDEDSALASFTEWTVLEPERPGPWLARGFAYWQLGQFDNALADFNTAVKLAGPMLTNSLAARGGLLHAMQRSKEAMSDFGEALKLNKADGMIYLFRGRSLCAEDKYQAGVNDFKTAIQLNAKDAEAHRNLALVLAACPQSRFRNGKRAVQSATDACELTEWNSWTALDTLAAACAEAGDFAEACRWIQKAADMTDGANRKQCLARLKQYQAHQPLRLDWNSLYGSPSAAADAPISK